MGVLLKVTGEAQCLPFLVVNYIRVSTKDVMENHRDLSRKELESNLNISCQFWEDSEFYQATPEPFFVWSPVTKLAIIIKI